MKPHFAIYPSIYILTVHALLIFVLSFFFFHYSIETCFFVIFFQNVYGMILTKTNIQLHVLPKHGGGLELVVLVSVNSRSQILTKILGEQLNRIYPNNMSNKYKQKIIL